MIRLLPTLRHYLLAYLSALCFSDVVVSGSNLCAMANALVLVMIVPPSKSLDASGGGVFRIIIGPAMLE